MAGTSYACTSGHARFLVRSPQVCITLWLPSRHPLGHTQEQLLCALGKEAGQSLQTSSWMSCFRVSKGKIRLHRETTIKQYWCVLGGKESSQVSLLKLPWALSSEWQKLHQASPTTAMWCTSDKSSNTALRARTGFNALK